MGETGDPIAAPCISWHCWPWKTQYVHFQLSSNRRIMSSSGNVVLSANVLSSISLDLTMASALSTGTLVNSAVIS